MKNLLFFLLTLLLSFHLKAQTVNCTFKDPIITLNFGTGDIEDMNTDLLYNYRPVSRFCPSDGHYTYTSYTSDCFSGDWHTIPEDHTPGDVNGNMLLVNASYYSGTFFTTSVTGLKGGTTYEFSVWMMNLCRITEKCPSPLLPRITIRLLNNAGKTVAEFGTGEVTRVQVPHWTPYRATFTTTPSETALRIVMIDETPGGCGNDFALDDIMFRECVKIPPVVAANPKKPAVAKTPPTKTPVTTKAPVTPKPVSPPVVVQKKVVVPTPEPKKETPPVKKPQAAVPKPLKDSPVVQKKPAAPKPYPKTTPPIPEKRQPETSEVKQPQKDSTVNPPPVVKAKPPAFPPPPAIITTRANPLLTQLEAEPGPIKISLYDNGTIDGDTVSIYHNNVLLGSRIRLTEKATTFNITMDEEHPRHELIMVAHNLGSIPPNTSLMIITTPSKRYEVFISSNEQKNAKVVINLKE